MIIIETPAPPVRERLVLVPPTACTVVLSDCEPDRVRIAATVGRDPTVEDLERAGYERARHARTEPRATDEELFAIADREWRTHPGTINTAIQAIALAVAARVRREACLVTRAVEAGIERVTIYRQRPGSDQWGVAVDGRKATMQAPADVPATLARLLDEATR